jgi:uncharacterized membrane protein
LALLVIIPLFLFQTNFVYEVVGTTSWSVPLSGYRMGMRPYSLDFGYVQELDVVGAHWMAENFNRYSLLVGDTYSAEIVLRSYGGMADYWDNTLIFSRNTNLAYNSTIFLSQMNVVDGLAAIRVSGPASEVEIVNTTDAFSYFSTANKIYSNGGSEVYYFTVYNYTAAIPAENVTVLEP